MTRLDTIIAGGTILDGSGAAGLKRDVGVFGDEIVAIGDLSTSTADTNIDASGLIVTPGFIDTHSHDDLAMLRIRSDSDQREKPGNIHFEK